MDIEEIEKRLRVLEDIEEIKQIQIRYVNALTTTDWDDLVDCFSENAFVDLSDGFRGKEEIAVFYKGEITWTHIGKEGNYLVHPVISVDGDKAKGSWLLYTLFSRPHTLQVKGMPAARKAPDWMHGFYEMEYVRENGKWKISMLKWRQRLESPRLEE